MISMMMMLSSIVPEDFLIKELKKAIDDYEKQLMINETSEETKKARGKVASVCMMFLSKDLLEGKSATEIVKEMEKIEQIKSVHDNLTNFS